jgi:hypothetical protein
LTIAPAISDASSQHSQVTDELVAGYGTIVAEFL